MPDRQPAASRRTRRPHVALIVDTALASGRGILRGIVRFAHEVGSWLIYHEPRSINEAPPAWLAHWRGDGIIGRFQNRRIARAILRTRLPAVDVLGVAREPGVPLVHVDNVAVGRMAADHLLDRGFTAFGFYHMQRTNWSDERREAFVRALDREGYACSVCAVPPATAPTGSWEVEQERLVQWLRRLSKPAGVMICSDWRGQAVMEACRRASIGVPDEVALIGVDDDAALCEACDPPLSSVALDYEKVGFEAARCLSRRMAGERLPVAPLLIPPLHVTTRRSTDILAIQEGPVAAAVRLIREKSCSGLSVEDIVRQVSMSRSVLQRRFRDLLGRTIHEEIMNTRLAEARFLLTETDLPLAIIAERAGFRHQEYMGAVFKARLSATPMQVRKRQGHTAQP